MLFQFPIIRLIRQEFPIDSFNGVNSFPNPNYYSVEPDLRYQCVEYVRRYYNQKKHRDLGPVPNGCAVNAIGEKKEGEQGWGQLFVHLNKISSSKPVPENIIVFGGNDGVGHVAIVTDVTGNKDGEIEFIQQNVHDYSSKELVFLPRRESSI